MQALCGLQGIFDLFNCKTPASGKHSRCCTMERLPGCRYGAEKQGRNYGFSKVVKISFSKVVKIRIDKCLFRAYNLVFDS